MTFPVNRVNERTFDPSWSGEVFVCDIDRTYLYTRFSSLKGLARIPFEFAVDKRDIEGMAPLLREVRRGPERQSRSTPLYFISASPAQLRPVIQRKMLVDGIEFDGTIFKDWIGVLASLRLKRFKEQLGYKLTALLLQRQDLPAGARQVLIGDDLESDALTFCLYADVTAGRIESEQLLRILRRHDVAFDDAGEICRLAGRIGRGELVRRAYIRMERHEDPLAFLPYWPHVAVCRGAFQMALSLWDQGSISTEGVERVVRELRERGADAGELEQRLSEACRRGLVDAGRAQELAAAEGVELPEVEEAWRLPEEVDPCWTPRHLRDA